MTNNLCRLLVCGFGFLSALDTNTSSQYLIWQIFDKFILLRGPCYHQTASPAHVKQLPCQLGPSSACFQNNKVHVAWRMLFAGFSSAFNTVQSNPWSWLENFPLRALVPHICTKRQHPLQPQSVHPAAIRQVSTDVPPKYGAASFLWLWDSPISPLHSTVLFCRIKNSWKWMWCLHTK